MTASAGTRGEEFPTPRGVLKRVTWRSFALAILLIVLGILAVLLPVESSLGVVVVISWLLMIGGAVHLIDVFRGAWAWHKMWTIAVAIAFFLTGLFLRLNLGIGLAALTLALIAFFLAQGVIHIVTYFRTRNSGTSGWLLFHGIVDVILAVMIWRHWPSGALWVVGLLVGINLIFTGTTRLMVAIALHRASRMFPQEAV
jgi:uncharacterized membrane protein HdeD (DUF308 family)